MRQVTIERLTNEDPSLKGQTVALLPIMVDIESRNVLIALTGIEIVIGFDRLLCLMSPVVAMQTSSRLVGEHILSLTRL